MARGFRRTVTTVRVSEVADFTALGLRWRDLEQRSAGSFFQSWSWTGCLAAERFPDPVLVEATDNGRTVALALFNRVRRRVGVASLYLGETGRPEMDTPFIEHNGVLAEAGREHELTVACLRAVASRYRLVLSGIGQPTLAAVRAAAQLTCVVRTRASPCADLSLPRLTGDDFLAGRSANTRQQIRRSDRQYGDVAAERAESVAAAERMLDDMAALHQAAWIARGQPGSFAAPFFRRFHSALIHEALPRGEIALLEVSAAGRKIGILYNFIFRDRMHAYQSGFDYPAAAGPAKPGLTCHHAAIRYASGQGLDSYDFLAGDDRYKRSLADHVHAQFWVEAGPVWSPSLLLRTLRAAVT